MTLHVTRTALGSAPVVQIETLNQASALYRAFIEQHGLGSSEAGQALIRHQGRVVAHISYNGKVWEGRDWQPDAKPIPFCFSTHYNAKPHCFR